MLEPFGDKFENLLEDFNMGTCLMVSGNRIIAVLPGCILVELLENTHSVNLVQKAEMSDMSQEAEVTKVFIWRVARTRLS